MSRLDPGQTSTAGSRSVTRGRSSTPVAAPKAAYVIPLDGMLGIHAPAPEGPNHQLAAPPPLSKKPSVRDSSRVAGPAPARASQTGASHILISHIRGRMMPP